MEITQEIAETILIGFSNATQQFKEQNKDLITELEQIAEGR
jgi:hypothetical protein